MIGAVYSPTASATIAGFSSQDTTYALSGKLTLQTNGTCDSTWRDTATDSNTLAPVMAKEIYIHTEADSAAGSQVNTALRSKAFPEFKLEDSNTDAVTVITSRTTGWIATQYFERGVQFYFNAAVNQMDVYFAGWRISR